MFIAILLSSSYVVSSQSNSTPNNDSSRSTPDTEYNMPATPATVVQRADHDYDTKDELCSTTRTLSFDTPDPCPKYATRRSNEPKENCFWTTLHYTLYTPLGECLRDCTHFVTCGLLPLPNPGYTHKGPLSPIKLTKKIN